MLACRIHQLLEQVDQGAQVVATEEIPLQEDITVPRRNSDLTAWVNVIHGCNERCTYCVVPNTRGNEQSRLPKDIRVSCCPLHSIQADQSCIIHASHKLDSCRTEVVLQTEKQPQSLLQRCLSVVC